MAERKRGVDEDDAGRMRREAWEAREARRRRGRVLRAFLGVVVLGVLAGLGIVYKDQLMALLKQKSQQQASAPKPPPPPPPAAAQRAPAPPAPPPPPAVETAKAVVPEAKPRAVAAIDDDAAKALIVQGKALVEELEFGKAAALFKDAARKQVSPPVKTEASAWARKAEQFDLATRHVTVSKFAAADTSYIVQMTDGREFQGLKKSENDDALVLQVIPPENPATLGESSWPLPKSEIARVTEVARKVRQEEFLQVLGQLESSVTPNIQRSTDYYDLVYVSKRLGLAKECLTFLNRAFNGWAEREPDPYVGESFRKERIRRTIDQCSLMLATGRAKHFVIAELNKLLKTFPDYQVAQDEVEAFKIQVLGKVKDDFRSTLKEVKKPAVAAVPAKKADAKLQTAKEMASEGEQIEFVVDNGGVQGHGAAAAIVEQANVKYDEGMRLYRGYKQGKMGNNAANNKTLKEAMVFLESAVALYDEALRKEPANKAVLDRQTEANMIVYACKKYQTL